jgi:hypothetical protein
MYSSTLKKSSLESSRFSRRAGLVSLQKALDYYIKSIKNEQHDD